MKHSVVREQPPKPPKFTGSDLCPGNFFQWGSPPSGDVYMCVEDDDLPIGSELRILNLRLNKLYPILNPKESVTILRQEGNLCLTVPCGFHS